MNPKKLNDHFFKQLAAQYVEVDGERLKKELEGLRSDQVVKPTVAFRNRVFRRVNSLRYRRYAVAAGLAAAILLMPLMLDVYDKNVRRTEQFNPGYTTAPSAEPNYATDHTQEASYAIIPLTMELPAGYHIASVEQDIEKTIYYIQNTNLDDVVLTVAAIDLSESSGMAGSSMAGLEAFTINGSIVYGIATKDYHLLRFEKDGILYELTCRYETNTLITLGKILLV